MATSVLYVPFNLFFSKLCKTRLKKQYIWTKKETKIQLIKKINLVTLIKVKQNFFTFICFLQAQNNMFLSEDREEDLLFSSNLWLPVILILHKIILQLNS